MSDHEVQSSDMPTCDAVDQQVTSQRYVYDDILTQAEKTIRLLTIHPGETEIIKCSLHLAKLSTELQFKALSYAWGTRPATKSIAIDGKSFYVRPSLWALLKRLQRWDEETVIWIDAICVDQSNIPERNQQVQLMSLLYSFADVVLVWLGEDHKGILSVLGAVYDHERCLRVSAQACKISLRLPERQRHLSEDILLREAIEYLSHSRYWSRAWVVQEYHFARDALFLYGEEGQMSREDWDRGKTLEPRASRRNRVNRFTFPSHRRPPRGSDQQLHSIVARYRRRECSDPRDHLYAYLGMAVDRDALGIDADYSITMDELCLKVVAAYSSAQAVAYYDHDQPPIIILTNAHGTLSDFDSAPGSVSDGWSSASGTDSQSGIDTGSYASLLSEADDPSDIDDLSDTPSSSGSDGWGISLPHTARERRAYYIVRRLRTAWASHTDPVSSDGDSAWITD